MSSRVISSLRRSESCPPWNLSVVSWNSLASFWLMLASWLVVLSISSGMFCHQVMTTTPAVVITVTVPFKNRTLKLVMWFCHQLCY